MTTDATGARTVICALPLCPSLVAVIVTGPPGATPVTSPLEETVAMGPVLGDHVIVRPVRMLFAPSRSVAVSCCVDPTKIDGVPGETVTEATGAGISNTP